MAQPEYQRIADDLRRRIAEGEWESGEQIPTLPELHTEYGVSEAPVRAALRILANEGLIESKARAGTRVRPRPPVHRLAADRYRSKPGGAPSTPYTRDQGIGWSEYRLDKKFEKVTASDELAALFECEPGEELLARHFVFYDNDEPTQMSTSYVRWADVAGTPVADPIHEPWPGGTRAQLATLGIRVTTITESFTAAMPTELEARTLRIGAGVPVLRYTRQHIADTGRVVEVAHPIVRRGDSTIVDFRIELDD
ncbi:GntR family transcriptional regulator [Streptomyces albogriseolus]|uniref:GntR family transcriptional regulator n=1 Tax=Streptomyces albogriseolus TaxID=1887 RepID=UPI0022592E6C|nr:GntR family transcriptional regulator [Streptomyces viridodiastaticus]MCX4622770.1 GntR family transcriptional regulator [Streptomyces viridodiastaticus]